MAAIKAVDPLSRVDPKYIVMLKNKPHPTYPGVLAAAMESGLVELSVKLIQAPNPENGGMAICEALARFPGANGQDLIFSEIGDCDGSNCTPAIAPHRVRMAATRAKGRALRDALGIGVALAEEMLDPQPESQPEPPPTVLAPVRTAPAPPAVVSNDEQLCKACGVELTAREIDGCKRKGIPPHCTAHAAELISKIVARPAV